jgi:hypothetical protein
MKKYHVLVKDSTEHTIDMVFKSGAVLAEVGSSPPFSFNDLQFLDESDREGGI